MRRLRRGRAGRAGLATVLGLAWAAAASAGETRVQVRGLLDVVGRGNDQFNVYNLTMLDDSNFDNLRARLFVDGGNERTRAFVQILMSDVGFSSFRFYGAYVLHQVVESHEIYLEAGKIPVPDGTWAPRTYSDKNPLIGIPLAYYYKSSLPAKQMPRDLDHLLSKRGQGQYGIAYFDEYGSVRGTYWATSPLLYDNCWDYGVVLLGAGRSFDWSFGVTQGAPAQPVAGPDNNKNVGLHAKVGWAPVPSLKLHVSAAHGAYLSEDVAPYLAPGTAVEDYAQMLWVGSLEWGWRHLTVHSEVFDNRFETPLRDGGLGVRSAYLETVYKFLPGWYGALRWDTIRFEAVESSAGRQTWDQNVERFEFGVGYRPTRELVVKAVGQLTDIGQGFRHQDLYPAVQVSFAY